ncbi:MAG TPA: PH domain-containing protein [Anaerolineales bacterium]
MAKTYVEELMGENERILLVARQHGFVLFSNILLEILLCVLIIVGLTLAQILLPGVPVIPVGYILVLVPVIGMIRDILVWSNRQYIITNRRVIQVTGVLSKEVLDTSLEKLTDVKMNQSFFGRLFNYGDIEILTASELGVNLFQRIGDPVGFKTAMLNAKEELGFGEVPMQSRVEEDIPTLIAQLDDLRKRGILSEAEFQKKKSELLAKM